MGWLVAGSCRRSWLRPAYMSRLVERSVVRVLREAISRTKSGGLPCSDMTQASLRSRASGSAPKAMSRSRIDDASHVLCGDLADVVLRAHDGIGPVRVVNPEGMGVAVEADGPGAGHVVGGLSGMSGNVSALCRSLGVACGHGGALGGGYGCDAPFGSGFACAFLWAEQGCRVWVPYCRHSPAGASLSKRKGRTTVRPCVAPGSMLPSSRAHPLAPTVGRNTLDLPPRTVEDWPGCNRR